MIHVIQHTDSEHLGLFEGFLAEWKVPYLYIRLQAGDSVPHDIASGDGLIVLGGSMSANDHAVYPWIRPEIELVRKCIAEGRPILGICLGSQLMARALGAKVYPSVAWEVGCIPVTLSSMAQQNPLFEGFEREFVVFQWHGETFDVPGRAVRLARGLTVPNQAFHFAPNAYAVQFHLEATKEMIEQWIKSSPDDLQKSGAGSPDLVLMTYDAYSFKMKDAAKRFLRNFLNATGLAAVPVQL